MGTATDAGVDPMRQNFSLLLKLCLEDYCISLQVAKFLLQACHSACIYSDTEVCFWPYAVVDVYMPLEQKALAALP